MRRLAVTLMMIAANLTLGACTHEHSGANPPPAGAPVEVATAASGLLTWTTALAGQQQSSVYATRTNVYVGSRSGLFLSKDSGTTWSQQTTSNGLASNNIIGIYAIDSSVYVATDLGLSISNDQGISWHRSAGTQLANGYTNNVYGNNLVLWAATNAAGLGVSNDAGTSWTYRAVADGLPDNLVWDVYASGLGVYAATNSGLSISRDGGNTWGSTGGLVGTTSVMSIAVDGLNIYAATKANGVFVSHNSGNTWTQKGLADGLGSLSLYKIVAVGPTVYAATSSGLSISHDSGNTWVNNTTAEGLFGNDVHGVYASSTAVYAAAWNASGSAALGAAKPAE